MKAKRFGALFGAVCAAAWFSRLMTTGAPPAEYCRLGDYEGHIAIFAPDGPDTPQRVTAIAVYMLPSADREALRGGIPVYSREELYRLLEDLGS